MTAPANPQPCDDCHLQLWPVYRPLGERRFRCPPCYVRHRAFNLGSNLPPWPADIPETFDHPYWDRPKEAAA